MRKTYSTLVVAGGKVAAVSELSGEVLAIEMTTADHAIPIRAVLPKGSSFWQRSGNQVTIIGNLVGVEDGRLHIQAVHADWYDG